MAFQVLGVGSQHRESFQCQQKSSCLVGIVAGVERHHFPFQKVNRRQHICEKGVL